MASSFRTCGTISPARTLLLRFNLRSLGVLINLQIIPEYPSFELAISIRPPTAVKQEWPIGLFGAEAKRRCIVAIALSTDGNRSWQDTEEWRCSHR